MFNLSAFTCLLLFTITFLMAHPMLETREISDDNVCGPYKRPIQNVDNETRCVPKLGSCKDSSRYVPIACIVSPCLSYQQKCRKAQYCYTDACNTCKARMYDEKHNEVCLDGPFGDV